MEQITTSPTRAEYEQAESSYNVAAWLANREARLLLEDLERGNAHQIEATKARLARLLDNAQQAEARKQELFNAVFLSKPTY